MSIKNYQCEEIEVQKNGANYQYRETKREDGSFRSVGRGYSSWFQ